MAENPFAGLSKKQETQPVPQKSNPFAGLSGKETEVQQATNPFKGLNQQEIQNEILEPPVAENPFIENKGDLQNKDVSPTLAKAEEVTTKNTITILGKEMQKTAVLGALMRPTGQYLVESMLNLNSDYFMEELGVPDTIPLDPRVKYPPHVVKLVDATGADWNKVKDRLSLSIFIDALAAKGMHNIKNALAPLKGASMKNAVNNLSNLSDEALDTLNREIKATGMSEQLATKIDDPVTNTKSMLMDPKEQIIGDEVMSFDPDTRTMIPLKKATVQDKFSKLMANADFSNNPDKIIGDGETLKDILPAPGKKDLTVSYFNRGPWAELRSPQNYAPNVYDKISLLEQRQAKIKSSLHELLDPFLKLEGTEQARLVGAVADGQEVAQEILAKGLLTEDGVKALQAWKKISAKAAEFRQLPEEKRISNYLTRIWDESKEVDLPTDPYLNMFVNTKSKFETARKGGKGYNLDIIKAAKVYIDDTAKKVAIREFKPQILQEIDDIKQLDPTRGDVADKYFLNYLGELNKASTKVKAKVSQAIKASFASGTLGWNVSTSLLNLTQAPVFGAAKIGYLPYIRGIKMFGKLNDKAGKPLLDLLNKSGIFEGGTVRELKGTQKFWSKIFDKVPGGKAIMDHQFMFMDLSEKINKGTIYLGAYDDVVRKIKYVTKAGVTRARSTAEVLKRSGVDIDGNVEEEAHKYARRAVADTQIDMGRAGKQSITMGPIPSMIAMYMSFPMKMGEYILKTGGTALNHLGKAVKKGRPDIALNSPEVRASMRLALNFATLSAIGTYSNVSLRRITDMGNFVPSAGPIFQAGYLGIKAIEALAEKDSTAAEKVLRTTLTLSGLPVNSPLWKVKKIVETAAANKGAKEEWTVYNSKTGAPMYKTDPLQFIVGELTGFVEPKTEAEYHEYMKERSREFRVLRNLNNTTSRELQKGNKEEAAQARREAYKLRQQLKRKKMQRDRETRNGK